MNAKLATELAEVQAALSVPPAQTLIVAAALVVEAVSVFLVLTIVLVHGFLGSTREPHQVAMYSAAEHLIAIPYQAR